MEAALDACRERMGDLVYEAALLRRRVKDLEAELEQLRSQPTAGPEMGAPPGPGRPVGLGVAE